MIFKNIWPRLLRNRHVRNELGNVSISTNEWNGLRVFSVKWFIKLKKYEFVRQKYVIVIDLNNLLVKKYFFRWILCHISWQQVLGNFDVLLKFWIIYNVLIHYKKDGMQYSSELQKDALPLFFKNNNLGDGGYKDTFLRSGWLV